MTTTTIARAHGTNDRPDAFYAGYADAYDEHQPDTTLDMLSARLETFLDNLTPNSPDAFHYLLGYSAAYVQMKLGEEAVVEAEETLAYEDRAAQHRAQASAEIAAYRAEAGEDR